MITMSSSARLVDFWAAWHQRSICTQPPGTGTVFRQLCCFPVQCCKNNEFSRQTNSLVSVNFSWFSCLFTCSSRSLSRDGFSDRLFTLSADRHLTKIMLGFHVRISKKVSNIVDHKMPLHNSPGFWLIVPGNHCRTSSMNRVFFRAANTSWNKGDPCLSAVLEKAPAGTL